MILLDSDHLSVLRYVETAGHDALTSRMRARGDETFAATIISAEEQMRGWLALLGKIRDVHGQIPAYRRLAEMIEFYADWEVLPFDEPAADHFERLRKARVRIGSQDLKIASVALARGALLLSAHLRDFRQVPELRVENWCA